MTVLGSLNTIRPAETIDAKVGPAKPGSDEAAVFIAKGNGGSQATREEVLELARADAEHARNHALRRVEANCTSTTLSALAQNQALLGEFDQAVDSARKALEMALQLSSDGAVIDPPSVRVAVDVLAHCGERQYAFDALSGVSSKSEALSVLFAKLATSLDRNSDALQALSSYDSPRAASLRGYLFARIEDYRSAVGPLRLAVRMDPDDVDSQLNLAISLWNLGSVRKAMIAALRATRTAPGRRDISLLYLEMLLAMQDVDRLKAEIASLQAMKVVPDAKFLEIQARTCLLKGDASRAVSLLRKASEAALQEGEPELQATIQANLVRLKYRRNQIDRGAAVRLLAELASKHPGSIAVAIAYAEIAWRRKEVTTLRRIVAQVDDVASDIQRAYFKHQIAVLEGDNDAAAIAAAAWFDLEPNNPMAAAAAIVAIGIGQARWAEAVVVAEHALEQFPDDRLLINNAAYVLAMSGRADDAIELLMPLAEGDFVLSATLGLAHLAKGDVGKGMRLYRQAADDAERAEPAWRSLMTVYQALVVRQLGLDKSVPKESIEAQSLVPFTLPESWRDQPDFLRLQTICLKLGYGWPLSI